MSISLYCERTVTCTLLACITYPYISQFRGLLRLHQCLTATDDDGCGRVHDNRRQGSDPAQRLLARRTARAPASLRSVSPAMLNLSLHSRSSVAIRSDFKNRTSCGVIARRGSSFFSASCSSDSWSTWIRSDSRTAGPASHSWLILIRAVALGQPDRRVQLQHDVVSMGAHSGNRPGDPVRLGNGVVDGMSKFTQKILEVIVELQG